MGRRSHKATHDSRRQVEAMAGYGMPEASIATAIGIDAKTLRKHYRQELDLGHIKANSAVAQSLFRKATGDGPQSVTAAIFWAKTRLGWKEIMVNELVGKEGLNQVPETDNRQLARAILAILGRAASSPDVKRQGHEEGTDLPSSLAVIEPPGWTLHDTGETGGAH